MKVADSMKKARTVSEHVPEAPPGLWSNCISVGPLVFIAGLTARDPNAPTLLDRDEYAQAKVIFGKMKHLVTAAGGAMDDIVKLTIFVTDIRRNVDVWRARKEFFTGDFPACSLVEVRALAKPDILVEIEGVAYLGCSKGAGDLEA
jgi:enamine deaminase RidA (YjgF/YER057c/UK114 family)